MVFLGLFIFFIFLIAYFRKEGSRTQETVDAAFWERENQANHIRRQDISGLPYITIPLEKFPMHICDNPEIKEFEQTLTELSSKKILNLSNQSNTDLKLKYGPANLEALDSYDANFSTLCHTFVDYAKCLQKLGYQKESQTVLELGISCGCDHSQNYCMLADLYQEQGQTAKLQELLTKANSIDSLMKPSIVSYIESKLSSCS